MPHKLLITILDSWVKYSHMGSMVKPLFPGYASCSNKLTCECVFPCVTTRSLTKSTFTASIFRLKQHSKVVFPASFLRLVPRTYPTLKMADNCKALPHVPPHFSPVSLLPPPHSSWALLHLGPPLLVLSSPSLRAWSIDQFFVQKQKLKIDRNIQFLIFFLNSRHCS